MRVFISGATGYMGRRLALRLVERSHQVCCLTRPESVAKLPPMCEPLTGNALDATSFAPRMPETDVYVHLVGVAHPAPWKERQFREIDQVSLEASVSAARQAAVRRFVYVSVAQPAPVMRAYQQVRAACEQSIAEAGLNAHILRPLYVLGPGHCWPYALVPFYRVLESIPSTREGARRLGLVTIAEMIAALAWAVETPVEGIQQIDVPAIRRIARPDLTSPSGFRAASAPVRPRQ